MYVLMYAMVDTFENEFSNLNQLYRPSVLRCYFCQSVRNAMRNVKRPSGKYASVTLLQHGPSTVVLPVTCGPVGWQVSGSFSWNSQEIVAPPSVDVRASTSITAATRHR